MAQRTWQAQGQRWSDPSVTTSPFSYETHSGPMTGTPWWDENTNSFFINSVNPAALMAPETMTVYGVPDSIAAFMGEDWTNARNADIERSIQGGNISLTAPTGSLTEDGRGFSVSSGNRWTPEDWGRQRGFIFNEDFYNRINPNWRNIVGLSNGGFGGLNVLDPQWGMQDWQMFGVDSNPSMGPGILQGLALMSPFIGMGFAAPGMAALEAGAAGAAGAGATASAFAGELGPALEAAGRNTFMNSLQGPASVVGPGGAVSSSVPIGALSGAGGAAGVGSSAIPAAINQLAGAQGGFISPMQNAIGSAFDMLMDPVTGMNLSPSTLQGAKDIATGVSKALGGGGGGGGMEDQYLMELQAANEREARSGRARGAVTDAFAGFDDAYFKRVADDYLAYYQPQVQRQFDDAREQLTYRLYDRGLEGSSVSGDEVANLTRAFNDAMGEVNRGANDYTRNYRNEVEGARQDLMGLANTAPNVANVANLAAERARAATAVPSYSPLADLVAKYAMNYSNILRQQRGQPRVEQQNPLLYNANSSGGGGFVNNRNA